MLRAMTTTTTETETQGWVPAIGFGDRLRVIRRKKHRSQTEMADLLGVKKVTYASWEAGTATPSHEDVVAIARRIQLLDRVPVAWTLGAYEEGDFYDRPKARGTSVINHGQRGVNDGYRPTPVIATADPAFQPALIAA